MFARICLFFLVWQTNPNVTEDLASRTLEDEIPQGINRENASK